MRPPSVLATLFLAVAGAVLTIAAPPTTRPTGTAPGTGHGAAGSSKGAASARATSKATGTPSWGRARTASALRPRR